MLSPQSTERVRQGVSPDLAVRSNFFGALIRDGRVEDGRGNLGPIWPTPLFPSLLIGRVGIRIVTFEACSGFTRVTARRIAQPP